MLKPKYEISDIAKMKHHEDIEFFITGILEETCPSGTQIFYQGRVWMGEKMGSKIQVSEVELGEKRSE